MSKKGINTEAAVELVQVDWEISVIDILLVGID